MKTLKSIRQAKNITGKTVLLRVAYDVPLKKVGKSWVVADSRRIDETIPTLKYLIDKKCKIVLLSWLGRPGGKVVEGLKMAPVAKVLAKAIKKPVLTIDDCVGPKVSQKISKLKNGQILMLENVRFYEEEEKNDKFFAALLLDGIDLIVFDAFAQSHRVHASTVGINSLLPVYSGFLLQKELTALQKVSVKPKRPFVVVIGGAKISDKVPIIEHLAPKADYILVGGAAANVFLKAKKINIGKSFVQDVFVDSSKKKPVDAVVVAAALLKKYPKKIIIPFDAVAAEKPIAKTKKEIVDFTLKQNIKPSYKFLDIGPRTIAEYLVIIAKAKTIFFNGPMGMFEIKPFDFGTKKIAEAIARSKSVSVIGGGDTEQVVGTYKLEGKFSHVSTGGGASLEVISGKALPAIEAVKK
jgi:3-phosphoglycerate kinase